MADEARIYRQSLTGGKVKLPTEGLGFLTDAAEQALLTGDARTAMQSYASAIMISPDDGALWTGLSRAWLALQPNAGESQYTFQRNAIVGGMERLPAVAHHQCAGRRAARDRAGARSPRLFAAGAAGLSGEPRAG